MKMFLLLPALLLAGTAHAEAGEKTTTTIVRGANGYSSITQSGDPAEAQVQIQKKPGQTVIQQRNGGNSSTVIQGSGPINLDTLPPDVLKSLTPEMRALLGR